MTKYNSRQFTKAAGYLYTQQAVAKQTKLAQVSLINAGLHG